MTETGRRSRTERDPRGREPEPGEDASHAVRRLAQEAAGVVQMIRLRAGYRARCGAPWRDPAWLFRVGLLLATLGIAAVTTIAGLVSGTNHHYLTWAVEMVVIAAGQFAIGAIRVPGWARLRRKQMEEISGRLPLGLTSLQSQASRDAEVGPG